MVQTCLIGVQRFVQHKQKEKEVKSYNHQKRNCRERKWATGNSSKFENNVYEKFENNVSVEI